MLLWGKVAQMGQATSHPQWLTGSMAEGQPVPTSSGCQDSRTSTLALVRGSPTTAIRGTGCEAKAQLPALPHECIPWAISPCCIPSSEVGQTSSSWGWREAPLNDYFSCEVGEKRGPGGQGSGQFEASGCSVGAVRRELSTCSPLAMGCGPPSSALTPPLTKLESEWPLPSLLP